MWYRAEEDGRRRQPETTNDLPPAKTKRGLDRVPNFRVKLSRGGEESFRFERPRIGVDLFVVKHCPVHSSHDDRMLQ